LDGAAAAASGFVSVADDDESTAARGGTAGAPVDISWTLPTDRRTGTGGGVNGRLRRGACARARALPADDASLLGAVD